MADQDNTFGEAVVTPKGKLFFFDVDTPNTQDKHPKNKYPSDKFDVTIGFEPTSDLSKLKAECDKVAKTAFGTTDGVDMPFTPGEEKGMDSMKGHIIVRAKCAKRPGLVDGQKQRITEGEIQAGMWGRVQATPMSYKSGKSKGVTLIFRNLQVLTDVEFTSLGGGQSAEDAFGDDDF